MNPYSEQSVRDNEIQISRWKRVRRFPLIRILLALLIVVIPFLVAQRVVALLPFGRTATSVLKALICVLVSYCSYVAYVRLFERRSVTEFASKAAAKELGQGFVIGALLFAATIGILALLGVYRFAGIGAWPSVILPLAVALVIGTFEEIVVRGIIFRITEESLGTWIALAISALIFGILHLVSPDSTLLGASSIVVGASVLLTGAYVVTRRLWLPIGIHVAWNFTQGGIFGITVSGHTGEGLLHGTLTGPEWLSGGAFGAEASVVATVLCFVVGLTFFALAGQKKRVIQPCWKQKR